MNNLSFFLNILLGGLLFVRHVECGETGTLACRPGGGQGWRLRGWPNPHWNPHLQEPLRSSVSSLFAQPAGSDQVGMWSTGFYAMMLCSMLSMYR